MSEPARSIARRILDRIFPKVPNFLELLADQCRQVVATVDLLARFMASGDADLALEIRKNEHEADVVKVRNIHLLNEAFSTPIDREDIYRAITDLDEVVNYCKTTVNEMHMLGVAPDAYDLEFAGMLLEGVSALARGYAKLATSPSGAAADADAARKAERRVEKIYRRALADLFQGDDYINMFKRREIYRHLSNAADRMAHCANTLHDIVVKIS